MNFTFPTLWILVTILEYRVLEPWQSENALITLFFMLLNDKMRENHTFGNLPFEMTELSNSS